MNKTLFTDSGHGNFSLIMSKRTTEISKMLLKPQSLPRLENNRELSRTM